ncbi:DUF6305 family protein [Calderihabitans maritimus]|uniref:DUF6305 family protein n=1 Tax=Calderihabitans maritimus TaxID=1246530 RepID=UPI000B513DF9|nr:DUF6305 family protein [Calderihabitans maritimus]
MRKALLILLIVSILILTWYFRLPSGDNHAETVPHLFKPLGRERALITTVGQGPEGLIVAKMADELKIRNYYRYKAEAIDVEGYGSLLVAVGYSDMGMLSSRISWGEEKQRALELVKAAKKQRIPVILLHLGGRSRRGHKNDELINMLAPHADYMIVLRNGNRDGFFSRIAKENQIPITVVRDMEAVKIPLNSVYR